MSCVEALGEKGGREIGMVGNIPTQSFANLCTCVTQVFGGHEQVCTVDCTEVARIAVVGAMTDALVSEAAARGADVYITGQLRQPAIQALRETKIAAIAIGHRRSEAWGLQVLAEVLHEQWSNLDLVLYS